MTRRPLRTLAALAAVGAVLVLPACGDDDDDDADPTVSAEPTGADTSDKVDDLQGALLTPAEVGPGFVNTGYDVPDENNPSPCGTPSVPKQFPDSVRLGADFQRGDLSFTEGVTVLPDVETADAAYQHGADGLDCENPSIQNQPVEVGEPRDARSEVGGDKAFAWTISGAGVQGSLVAVQVGEKIVTFTFLVPEGADLSDAPNPVPIVKTGVEKIAAAE